MRILLLVPLLLAYYGLILQSEREVPLRPAADQSAEVACEQVYRSAARVRKGRRISSSTYRSLEQAHSRALHSRDSYVHAAAWVLGVALTSRDRAAIDAAISEMLNACKPYESATSDVDNDPRSHRRKAP